MPDYAPDHIEVILSETRHAGNIGAVARLMKNLGLASLTLINPTARAHLEAVRMAPGACEIIERARIVPSLEEAGAGFSQLLAVSRRPRRMRKTVYSPESAAEALAPPPGAVGVVFGSEKWGLSNESVRLCHGVITIPTAEGSPSFNLAQAAAITLYAICARRRAAGAAPREGYAAPAGLRERKALFESMERAMELAGYFRKEGNQKTIADIEDIFNRAAMDERDARLMLGVFRRINNALERR